MKKKFFNLLSLTIVALINTSFQAEKYSFLPSAFFVKKSETSIKVELDIKKNDITLATEEKVLINDKFCTYENLKHKCSFLLKNDPNKLAIGNSTFPLMIYRYSLNSDLIIKGEPLILTVFSKNTSHLRAQIGNSPLIQPTINDHDSTFTLPTSSLSPENYYPINLISQNKETFLLTNVFIVNDDFNLSQNDKKIQITFPQNIKASNFFLIDKDNLDLPLKCKKNKNENQYACSLEDIPQDKRNHSYFFSYKREDLPRRIISKKSIFLKPLHNSNLYEIIHVEPRVIDADSNPTKITISLNKKLEKDLPKNILLACDTQIGFHSNIVSCKEGSNKCIFEATVREVNNSSYCDLKIAFDNLTVLSEESQKIVVGRNLPEVKLLKKYYVLSEEGRKARIRIKVEENGRDKIDGIWENSGKHLVKEENFYELTVDKSGEYSFYYTLKSNSKWKLPLNQKAVVASDKNDLIYTNDEYQIEDEFFIANVQKFSKQVNSIIGSIDLRKLTLIGQDKERNKTLSLINEFLNFYSKDSDVASRILKENHSKMREMITQSKEKFASLFNQKSLKDLDKESTISLLTFLSILEQTQADADSIISFEKLLHQTNVLFGKNEQEQNEMASKSNADTLNFFKFTRTVNNGEVKEDNDESSVKFSLQTLQKNDMEVTTKITPHLVKILNPGEQDPSEKISYTVLREGKDITKELLSANYTIGFQITDFINIELYKYYKSRGIDIYNPFDEAFRPCYVSEGFDYDLTQAFRKLNLFQNITFVVPGVNCQYTEIKNDKVLFLCNSTDEISALSFKLKELTLEDFDRIDNLPTLCGGELDKVYGNIAFWLFLCTFITFVSGDVILASCFFKKVTCDSKQGGSYFPIENSLDDNFKTTKASQKFSTIFYNNLTTLHPFSSISYNTFPSHNMLNTSIFVFNLLSMFGFNALYFNESMIEERIFDKSRDKFTYPLKTELVKIVGSVGTCVVLTFLIRLLTLTSLEKRNRVINKSSSERQTDYWFVTRAAISGLFMGAVCIFFFYYCVVFCGVYINAQFGWLYSGIWSLVLAWGLCAPVYVLIISIIEKLNFLGCTYYLKQLFIF